MTLTVKSEIDSYYLVKFGSQFVYSDTKIGLVITDKEVEESKYYSANQARHVSKRLKGSQVFKTVVKTTVEREETAHENPYIRKVKS